MKSQKPKGKSFLNSPDGKRIVGKIRGMKRSSGKVRGRDIGDIFSDGLNRYVSKRGKEGYK